MDQYGIDWDEVVPSESESVVVPQTLNPLSDGEYTQLCSTINPVDVPSECHSIDVFCAVKEFTHTITLSV